MIAKIAGGLKNQPKEGSEEMKKLKGTNGWYIDKADRSVVGFPPPGTKSSDQALVKVAKTEEELIRKIQEVPIEVQKRKKSYYAKGSKDIDRKKKELRRAKVEAARNEPRKHKTRKRTKGRYSDQYLEYDNGLRCRDPCTR